MAKLTKRLTKDTIKNDLIRFLDGIEDAPFWYVVLLRRLEGWFVDHPTDIEMDFMNVSRGHLVLMPAAMDGSYLQVFFKKLERVCNNSCMECGAAAFPQRIGDEIKILCSYCVNEYIERYELNFGLNGKGAPRESLDLKECRICGYRGDNQPGIGRENFCGSCIDEVVTKLYGRTDVIIELKKRANMSAEDLVTMSDEEVFASIMEDTRPTAIYIAGAEKDMTSETRKNASPDVKMLFGKSLPLKQFALEDLEKVDALKTRYPHAEDVIEGLRVGLERQWSFGSDVIKLRPTIIVGAPGVGKTRLLRDFCKAISLPFSAVSLAGQSDSHLMGVASGWSSSEPSWMTRTIARSGIINPGLILDELDKGYESRNGQVRHELLTLLEPGENGSYREKFLPFPVDASHLNWMFSANTLEGIPAPLLSRCVVYEMRNPEPEHLPAIIESIVQDYADDLALDRRFFTLSSVDYDFLVEMWSRHKSIRMLYEMIRRLLDEQQKRIARA